MLRDRYAPDPFFWAITERLAVEMEPEPAQIDRILDDDELFQLIKQDMSQRYPLTLETGRGSTPVEVNLRMLAVKRLYRFTYRQTEWHVGDSLVRRWFCRVYFNTVPDHLPLNRWALLIKPETLRAFYNWGIECEDAPCRDKHADNVPWPSRNEVGIQRCVIMTLQQRCSAVSNPPIL